MNFPACYCVLFPVGGLVVLVDYVSFLRNFGRLCGEYRRDDRWFGLISRNLRTGGGYASSMATYGGVVPVHKFCGSSFSHCVSTHHSLHTRSTKYVYGTL